MQVYRKKAEIKTVDLQRIYRKIAKKEANVTHTELNQVLDPVGSIQLEKSMGSTNLKEVLRMTRKTRKELGKVGKILSQQNKNLISAYGNLQNIVNKNI